MAVLRCTGWDLSELESESFVFEVAAQAGRWRGWKGGHGNHTPSCKQRWCHPRDVLGNVPADGPRGWEQSKNPPGAAGTSSREYWDDWSLAKWHFPSKCFGRLGNFWWAPRVPSPQCVEGRGSSQHPSNPWEAGSSQSWKESFCFIHPINDFHFPFSDWCRSSQTTAWIYTEFNLKQDNAAGKDSKINFTPPTTQTKERCPKWTHGLCWKSSFMQLLWLFKTILAFFF